jgi:hypothetical protein
MPAADVCAGSLKPSHRQAERPLNRASLKRSTGKENLLRTFAASEVGNNGPSTYPKGYRWPKEQRRIMTSGETVFMVSRLELNADEAAQDVLNAWGACRTSVEPQPFSADFTALFAKMQDYRNARTIADNRREQNRLTKEEAQREQITKRDFLDAYRAFYSNQVKRAG